MKCEPSEDDPFSFEGPEIYKCTGCAVNWKQGKNLTVKTVKKKQKHKSKGNVRTVTKTVKNDSFFNFFDPVRLLLRGCLSLSESKTDECLIGSNSDTSYEGIFMILLLF